MTNTYISDKNLVELLTLIDYQYKLISLALNKQKIATDPTVGLQNLLNDMLKALVALHADQSKNSSLARRVQRATQTLLDDTVKLDISHVLRGAMHLFLLRAGTHGVFEPGTELNYLLGRLQETWTAAIPGPMPTYEDLSSEHTHAVNILQAAIKRA